jgi:hypothetical protein
MCPAHGGGRVNLGGRRTLGSAHAEERGNTRSQASNKPKGLAESVIRPKRRRCHPTNRATDRSTVSYRAGLAHDLEQSSGDPRTALTSWVQRIGRSALGVARTVEVLLSGRVFAAGKRRGDVGMLFQIPGLVDFDPIR